MKKEFTQLIFQRQLPNPGHFGPGALLIYDQIFEQKPGFKKWISRFPNSYAVKSGERLKNIDFFPNHMKKILKATEGVSLREIHIVALGGGSVGDFAGFVASILKRGVRLTHLPSTWLAAIDSSHGGKTGLNVSKLKNQVGSFYPAETTYLVQSLLTSQPEVRLFEALGEVIKISLLEGRGLWKKLKNCARVDTKLYWNLLPLMIQSKNKIVSQDPFEKSGQRHLLNFGHTMGHVWESQLKLPHGVAVLYGTAFAVEWSLEKGYLSSQDYYDLRLSEIGSYLPDRMDLLKLIHYTKNPKKFLMQDKKLVQDQKIRFVFLTAPGKPRVELVSLKDMALELKRQKTRKKL